MISCASCHRCHEIWTSSAVTGKQHSSPSSCLYHRATLNYRCLHHSFDQADQNSRSDSKSSHGVRRIIIMVITMIKIRVLIIIILMIMRIDGEVQPWCRTNAILEIRSPAQITSGARPHLHHHYLRHFHRHQHHHYLRHCHRHQHHNRHFMIITILGFIFMLSSPGSGKKRTLMGHNCLYGFVRELCIAYSGVL